MYNWKNRRPGCCHIRYRKSRHKSWSINNYCLLHTNTFFWYLKSVFKVKRAWFEQRKRKICYFKPQKNNEKQYFFKIWAGLLAVPFSSSAGRRWCSSSLCACAWHKNLSPDTWEWSTLVRGQASWARARRTSVGKKGTLPSLHSLGAKFPAQSSVHWSAQHSCPPTWLLMANKQLKHPQAAFFLAPVCNHLNNQKGSERCHQLQKLLHSQDVSLKTPTRSN